MSTPSSRHDIWQTVGYDVEVCVTQGYASPDHHWPTTKPVMLDDDTGNIAAVIVATAIAFTTLQTSSHLSHVLNANLFSSVERTRCHRWTCQFWCSLTTHGALLWSLLLTISSETCSPVACWNSFWRALVVLLLVLLTQRNKCGHASAVMQNYSPVQFSWSKSVSHYSFHVLETVLGKTANLFVCHPGGAGKPVPHDWVAGVTSSDYDTRKTPN